MSIFFFFKCSHTTNSQFRHRQKKKRQKKAKEAKAPHKNTLCAVLCCAELWPRCTARSSPYHIQTHFSYLTAINFPTNGARTVSCLCLCHIPCAVPSFYVHIQKQIIKYLSAKWSEKIMEIKKYNDSARLSSAQCCSLFAFFLSVSIFCRFYFQFYVR